MKYVIAACIVIVICLIYATYSYGHTKGVWAGRETVYNESMRGVWLGDPTFCVDSEIPGMMMDIKRAGKRSFEVLLVIPEVAEYCFNIKLGKYKSKSADFTKLVAPLSFGPSKEPDESIPLGPFANHGPDMELHFWPTLGIMKWQDADKIYAIMHKSGVTNLGNI